MRYVAVPVQTGYAGGGTYLSWVDKMMPDGEDCFPYGRGSTEDEAFADLLAKLGYKGAIPVSGDNLPMMKFIGDCVEGYDSDEVAKGLREFLELCEDGDGGDREAK